jgi:DNA-binding NtrC family response regulator
MVRREALPEKVLGGDLDEVRDLLRVEQAAAGSGPDPASSPDERACVEAALARSGGDKSRAARLLGWNRMRLYRRMKSLGIPSDSGKDPSSAQNPE